MPEQQRWCAECGEDRRPHQPPSDRLCDICGAVLEARDAPAPQEAVGQPQPPATVTIPLRQLRRLRDLLLASLTGGEGELGLAQGLMNAGGLSAATGGEGGEAGDEGGGGDEAVDVAALLAQLGLLGGGGPDGFGGGPGGEGARKGLSDEEIAALPRSTLQKTSALLLACALTVDGDSGAGAGGGDDRTEAIPAIPGDFSPVPPGGAADDDANSSGGGGGAGARLELVAGDPVTADAPSFANAGELAGRVVVLRRGKQTFGRMAAMARAAGARGVCVVNSVALWPYLMKDTAGEAKGLGGGGDEGGWFIAMVPRAEGEALLGRLAGGAVLGATMAVTRVEKDCVICVDAFTEGEEVARLPCGHGFHLACVERWLRLAKTCPYCRAEVRVRKG